MDSWSGREIRKSLDVLIDQGIILRESMCYPIDVDRPDLGCRDHHVHLRFSNDPEEHTITSIGLNVGKRGRNYSDLFRYIDVSYGSSGNVSISNNDDDPTTEVYKVFARSQFPPRGVALFFQHMFDTGFQFENLHLYADVSNNSLQTLVHDLVSPPPAKQTIPLWMRMAFSTVSDHVWSTKSLYRVDMEGKFSPHGTVTLEFKDAAHKDRAITIIEFQITLSGTERGWPIDTFVQLRSAIKAKIKPGMTLMLVWVKHLQHY
jgi:hypothetical protein